MRATRVGAGLLAAGLAAALSVGACGDDDGGGASPDATVDPTATSAESTTTTAATTTTENVEAAVEQAFYDQWDAFVEILSDPDPSNPLIDRHFTGEARDAILDTISEYVADGRAARLPKADEDFVPTPTSIEVDSPSQASVIECTIDGVVIFSRSTGQIINDEVSAYRAHNTFVREDGRWKLSRSRQLDAEESSCPD